MNDKKVPTQEELNTIALTAATAAVQKAVSGEEATTPVAANDAKMGFWTKAVVTVGSTAAIAGGVYVAYNRFFKAA